MAPLADRLRKAAEEVRKRYPRPYSGEGYIDELLLEAAQLADMLGVKDTVTTACEVLLTHQQLLKRRPIESMTDREVALAMLNISPELMQP